MASEKPRDESRDEFHQALGDFVTKFAMVEGTLYITIRIMADISPEALSALLPNATASTLISKTRQLLALGDQPESDKSVVTAALDQLQHINGMRNSVLHHTVFENPSEAGFLTTDALFNAGKAAKFRDVSSNALGQMTYDLVAIYFRLFWWQHQVLRERGFTPETTEELQKRFDKALREAWRYRHVPPSKRSPWEADPDDTAG